MLVVLCEGGFWPGWSGVVGCISSLLLSLVGKGVDREEVKVGVPGEMRLSRSSSDDSGSEMGWFGVENASGLVVKEDVFLPFCLL